MLTWCTNTSWPPSSGVMKPHPLATLNHLQEPLRNSANNKLCEMLLSIIYMTEIKWFVYQYIEIKWTITIRGRCSIILIAYGFRFNFSFGKMWKNVMSFSPVIVCWMLFEELVIIDSNSFLTPKDNYILLQLQLNLFLQCLI